jgi:16S rRNA G966 N2-methylase RsmD
MEAKKALRQCASFGYQFDVIYLDPPYAKKDVDKLLLKIMEDNLLKEDGIIIYECLKEDAPIEIEGLELYKQANYGIVRVNYYRR